jgi:hypothetical protein
MKDQTKTGDSTTITLGQLLTTEPLELRPKTMLQYWHLKNKKMIYQPEEEGELIMANVSCCICQTRRNNLPSKCGHLYCSTCYNTYWKQKRANWNRVLFGAFQQKKVACATCRKELGTMRKIHFNGV